jgi:thymidylate synthase (FAD)
MFMRINMNNIDVTLNHFCGNDLTVVNAARVSFGKKKEEFDAKDEKLIQYLAKHKHISPFGHCFASFHVKAPLFVARQLVKHKFLRWNEISRRYVDDEPEFYEPRVWRGRSEDKKQGSSGEVKVEPMRTCVQGSDIEFYEEIDVTVGAVYQDCLNFYEHLLEQGVAPEQARMVLPQSMMTEWYWSGSLDAFADMCRLRLMSDTQEETRMVAGQIDTLMAKLYPVSWEALLCE